MRSCGRCLLLFECLGLAHDDRRGRRAEARGDVFDPMRSGFTEPPAMLAAIGAVKFAGMRSFARSNDADVAAARPIAVDWPVELDLQADEGIVAALHERRPADGDVGHVCPRARRHNSRAASWSSLNRPTERSSAVKASAPPPPRWRIKPMHSRPS